MQFAFAHDRDQNVQGLLGHTVDLLDVQQRTVAQRRSEGTVDEDVGVVALRHHACRIEVPDESSRGEFRVALDELEPDAELVGNRAQQRRLAGSGRALDHHVTIGDQRGDDQFDLAPSTDDRGPDRGNEFGWKRARCVGDRWLRHVTSSPAEPSDPRSAEADPPPPKFGVSVSLSAGGAPNFGYWRECQPWTTTPRRLVPSRMA